MPRKKTAKKPTALMDSIHLDPNYQKEQAKYDNPIPSREFILQIIREQNRPVGREELLTIFGIKDDERTEAVRRRLRAMENDGQLVFTKRKCYALPEKMDLLKGTVIGHRDGYGFLQVEGRTDKKDLFIPNAQMQRVMHGDFVLAQPTVLDRKGRQEVRIVFSWKTKSVMSCRTTAALRGIFWCRTKIAKARAWGRWLWWN